jgi:hypothetical protein
MVTVEEINVVEPAIRDGDAVLNVLMWVAIQNWGACRYTSGYCQIHRSTFGEACSIFSDLG